MEQIAVCMVVNDLFYETKYCIESLCATTSCDLRLHILDNGSEDEKLIAYLKEVCAENKWFLKRVENPVPVAEAWNLIIQHSYQNWVCIFPMNILVRENWAEDLMAEYLSSEKAGVISIRNGTEKLSLIPVIHKCETKDDYFKNVWFNDNNFVEGIQFFHRDRMKPVGVFDTSLNAVGYEQFEWSFRFHANGFTNYYIPEQSCVKLDMENDVLFPKKNTKGAENLKSAIEIMFKTRHFIK